MDFTYRVTSWFVPVLVWTLVWKSIACWKAARREERGWFILIFFLNTLSVLPIFYIVLTNRKEKLESRKKLVSKEVVSKIRKSKK